MPAKTPLARDKIDAPAAYAVPFRPYCGGVVTRTRNVSECMLVLALCLVVLSNNILHVSKTKTIYMVNSYMQSVTVFIKTKNITVLL